MSTVTKSIGTSGRDYSTITAWEADLDNAAVYASGNHAVGECYNDSVFDEAVTINGGRTIGLASVTLTVEAGERHSGIAGTGARIVVSSTKNLTNGVFTSTPKYVVEWFEFDANGTASQVTLNSRYSAYTNLLLHGYLRTATAGDHQFAQVSNGTVLTSFQNSMVWDAVMDTGNPANPRNFIGLVVSGSGANDNTLNITVHGVKKPYGTGYVRGISAADYSGQKRSNVICTDTTGSVDASSIVDFYPSSFSNATVATNLSSDATASGTGSLTNKLAASQFVSTVAGSEDLHLKSGADAINAGTDLGTTPTGVNIDIDGRDRHAMDDVWDIGADEYVNPVARFPWQVRRERRMAGAR